MPTAADAAAGAPDAADGAAGPAHLALAVRLLVAGGTTALTEVLALARADIGCDELTLRAVDGLPLHARSGDRPAGPPDRDWSVLDAPIRAGAACVGLLTAAAELPFTVRQAMALAAYADVLGLALDADRARIAADAGRVVLDAEADRAQLAAALHESVGQALVTVRYAADLVVTGRGDAAALDEPVRAALTAFRQAHRDLRPHALEAGLRAALRELGVRAAGDRPADGQPVLRLTVDATDPALDDVAPPVAVAVQRVAEAALRGATGWASLRAACGERRVKLSVESADIAYDASELDRWSRRVSALGGDLSIGPDGVELVLPVELAVPDQREGRHDHGLDL